MKEIEWAELRINDGDGGDYLNIYSDDKTYSYLLEDVFERMNETDLARITAERDAAISDLQDAVDFVYNVYGENNETLAAITTAHWRAVIADVKKSL